MKNPVKKPSWWDEFIAFAVKGNAMALAVGTIIGAAFSTITKSLTDDIIMPIIAIFMGGIDFSEMKIVLPRLFGDPMLDRQEEGSGSCCRGACRTSRTQCRRSPAHRDPGPFEEQVNLCKTRERIALSFSYVDKAANCCLSYQLCRGGFPTLPKPLIEEVTTTEKIS